MKTSAIPLAIVLALATACCAAEAVPGKSVRIAAVCLSIETKDRNLDCVLKMLEQAAAERADVVCLPEECVPTDGGPNAQAALDAIARLAGANSMMVAVALKEKEGDQLYSTSYLIGPDGKQIGKYRKSHRLPDEPIALGNELPVFDTPLGKIGLMIGTDHCWPEIPLVLALQGAELILWSHGVEPVPQDYSLDITTRIRSFDDHVVLARAGYAGELPYLCSNWSGYTGEPVGHACVVDRSGIIEADTGAKPGVALASIDLARRKDVFYHTFIDDRSLFHYLVDADLKPIVHRGSKRKIRATIAQVGWNDGPNPDPDSNFFKVIDEAGSRGSDVIVMSEFNFPTDTPEAAKTFAQVAERAKKYNTYIVIGGLHDPQMPGKDGRSTSWAYLWDRDGNVMGKYRISQYGGSKELPVFRTDFGVVGLILCGDIYSQEMCRSLALQGAEIILCGSQAWGASGQYQLRMQQARAIDNRIYMVTTHFPTSEQSQRSYVIDPYGYPLTATPYWSNAVVSADVDLDAGGIWFARSDKPYTARPQGYLDGYLPKTMPERRTDFRDVLLAGRRPELYRPIVEKSLAGRDFSAETSKKMAEPR